MSSGLHGEARRITQALLVAAVATGAALAGCGDSATTPPPADASTADVANREDAGGGADVVTPAEDRPTPEDRPAPEDRPTPEDRPAPQDVVDVPAPQDVTDVPAPEDVPPAEDVPATPINVRVAHLSPGAPAVDFCLRPASATTWTGVSPTLRGLGVTAGLAYSQVTRYLSVPPGAYTARLVAPDSANCDTALAGLPDVNLPALPEGARATVGAVGILGEMGATAFRLNAYPEDEPAAMGQLKIRFVHASPGTPAVDVGIPGMGTMFTGVFNNVAFPAAAAMNFTSATALSNVSLAARVAGTATQAGSYPLQIDGVNVPLGATVSAFAVGRLGNQATPLSALLCIDGTSPMGNPALTACTVATNRVPTPINVRVAHLSPGAPAVDFCLRPASATTWTGVSPTLRGLGVTAGLAYTQVTRYLSVPPGAYTARLVAPNSANCDTALAGLPDVNLPALPEGARATVGAVGILGEMGATAFRLNAYPEDEPAAMGQLKIRFVHASPGTPAVDVGIPGMGTMFTGVFNNVAFPAAAAMNFTSNAALSNVSLAARVAGTATQAGSYPLQIDGVNVPLGATVSAFAVGRLGNQATPLSALLCIDGTSPMGNAALTACTVATNRVPTPISVRVAHLSPDAPAVDFCVRPAGATTWTGVSPTLRGLGVTAGLAYPQVTRYLSLPPGAYTVRLVAPGSANCDASLGGLPDSTLPNLPEGAFATVAAVGALFADANPDNDFRLAPIVDDNAAAPAGQARLRFVHASPGTPAVDVGIPGAGTAFTGVFTNTAFPNASSYVNTAPLANATIAARVAGAATQAGSYPLQLNGVSLPAGARATVFAVGILNSDQVPLSALVCTEGAEGMSPLTTCALLPERIFVRVAHLAPSAPAVDFCLRPSSAMSFAGVTPTLRSLGATGGFAFPTMTRYLALPPGAYTARIVAPNSANCDTALAGLPDIALPSLPAGTRATVAASGRLGDTGATAFNLRPFIDGNARPDLGRANLRFIHLSAGAPAVDVGLVSGMTFTPVFTNTPFGALGNAMGADATTGYLSVAPISNGTLQVRAAGTSTAVLTINGFNLPSVVARGMSMSAFAIGTVGGTGNDRLSALVCLDREPSAPGLAGPCVRLP